MDVSANARRGQRQQPSPAWRGTQVDRRRCWAESAPGGSAPREARAGKGGGWRHSKSCKGRRACRWGGKAEANRRESAAQGRSGGSARRSAPATGAAPEAELGVAVPRLIAWRRV